VAGEKWAVNRDGIEARGAGGVMKNRSVFCGDLQSSPQGGQ